MSDRELEHEHTASLTSVMPAKSVVVVATIVDPVRAAILAEVLADSPVGALEITLRTQHALESISAAIEPGALPVGAGTITDPVAATAARDAGAQFLVSPGFREDLCEHARRLGVPYVPGVLTASELLSAQLRGFSEVKLFPAEPSGGIKLVETLGAVFPSVSFIPTGGIDSATAPAYLAHPQVVAVGGSWVAPRHLIEAGDWAEIARRAKAIPDPADFE